MREKRRVGITFGCFIPLHKGHLSIIKQAETENNSVILGVTGIGAGTSSLFCGAFA